jgi:hypothetical protein
MKTQLIILLTLISMLLACGNEETPGEVETQEQAPDQTTNTAAETESPEQTEDETAATQEEAEQTTAIESTSLPIIRTNDLVSNTEFSFNSNANLQLKLPASPSSTMNYFINVCSDFSDENGIQKINYDSCQLRTLLKADEQEFSLSLSNAETVLIAQIWPIEADSQAITFFYNIQEDGESWHITLP